jgi:hypothetical protein
MNYSPDVVLIDALTGLPAMGLIILTALFLGGFSFFAPWMIVSPLIMFIAGLVRARSDGNAWLKGFVISLPLLAIIVLLGNVVAVFFAPFLILPSASGVWIRRRRHPLDSE